MTSNFTIANQLKVINDAMHKAARFMQRDFNEIMQLQGSKKGVHDFTHKCYSRLQRKLTTELNEVRPQYDVILANEAGPETKYFYVIEPISGLTNFQHSIPFCAIVIGLFNNNEPLAVAIHNPILRETFYAAQNFGAWIENYNETVAPKSRMRVSHTGDMNDAVISTTGVDILYHQNRILGSTLLEMAYLASGRLDMIINESESLLTQAGLMMIREAGGFTKQEANKIIASNEALSKQSAEIFQNIIVRSHE